ncbi:glycosyltransferase [Erwinia sp. PK3-005]|uniref:Glycosyltransferase n=1 Tax=Mixta hanseatica TaxID=2872648 RepID=A0ABY4R8R1_9GAMM|nr:glycosyltransferase [Mixta hanseatica]UQY44022.1 glycosyltransferase [Mixta hanseatica]
MIIDGLPGGGAEKVVLTLAKGLLSLGHQVSLFSLRSVCDYPLPAGLDYQVIEDGCRKPWRKITELQRRARLLDRAIVKSEQQNGAFDLVISHLHKTDRIVSRCRHLDPAKTWYCLHGVFSASYLARRKGFSRWLKVHKTRRVYQNRNIIGVSQFVINDLKQHYGIKPAKEAVIYNPFDVDYILQQSQEACELAGQDYLLHVGRFHATKRHDRLLQAYAHSGVQAPLVLIGQGNDARIAELKQLAEQLGIADRVIFKGFTHNPYAWINHARMLIVSSDSEGFGNVLVEALLCQTSVVSTRCPGGPESILQGELARGLAEMTSESLAERIRDIYYQPLKLQQLDLSVYHVETICQRYLALIER